VTEGLKESMETAYYHGQREDLLELLPGGVENVLEVGCGAGGTGALLRAHGCREIVGIELNPRVAIKAQRVFDRLFVGNVEELDLTEYRGHFDAIIYGDVLEHLIDPWRVLHVHRGLLCDTGVAVASLPNIRYYKVIRDLALHGLWEYRDRGILDRTHLRFFTYGSILKLFETSGFVVDRVEGRPSGSRLLKTLNHILRGRLHHILVVQYRVVARKSDRSKGGGVNSNRAGSTGFSSL
jgi:SAM-dependent methyltransferase